MRFLASDTMIVFNSGNFECTPDQDCFKEEMIIMEGAIDRYMLHQGTILAE